MLSLQQQVAEQTEQCDAAKDEKQKAVTTLAQEKVTHSNTYTVDGIFLEENISYGSLYL